MFESSVNKTTWKILNLESKTEGQMWQRHRTIIRGGHRTFFLDRGTIGMGENMYWEGGHCTYFVNGGSNWGGDTAQH